MYRVILQQCFTRTVVLGVVCTFGVATSQGGWPHRVPDFSEEATWTENDILLAEVVSAKGVPVLRGSELHRTIHVTVTVAQRFTPGEPNFQVQKGPEITLSAFLFPVFREFNQPTPVVGETVVIVSSKRRMSPIYLLQPGTRGVERGIAHTLQAISKLRLPEASSTDILDAAFEPDSLVAQYAMKRLLAATPPQHDQVFLRKLRAVREADNMGADVALAASRLLSHLTGQPPLNRDEYLWLKRRLSDVTACESACLNAFLRRIQQYSDDRPETIILLSSLARDPNVPDAARIAYLNAMTTRAMFQHRQPDAHSGMIISLLVDVLEHECRFVRVRTAMGLGTIIRYLCSTTEPSEAQEAHLAVIETALRNSLRTETDRATRDEIRRSLSAIDAFDEGRIQIEEGR